MASIKLSSVCERDVDLLVAEQLATSPEFAALFLKAIGLGPGSTVIEVAHSVQSLSGESDLEVLVQEGELVHRVLIEDKVDAEFQPDQAARYTTRAQGYVAAAKCGATRTVLVAPDAYIEAHRDQHHFDAYVSLEEVSDWVGQAGNEAVREFKRSVLQLALKRAAEGWISVPDDSATTFWRSYWELARQRAPQLQMRKPPERPAGSTWIYFRPPLPKGVDLIHKIVPGHVDLQFAGKGESLDELRNAYGPLLHPDMEVVKAQKSAVIRIEVPPCTFSSTFNDCAGTVEAALNAAGRLAAIAACVKR